MASSSSCDATGVPFTLLGALITAGPAAWPACVGGGRAFLRDYARRGTNALLWAGLLSVTWVLLLRVAAMLRLWALGSRIPGPRALLADPGLAAVLRDGGDITGWWPFLSPPYSLFILTGFGSVGWVQLVGMRLGFGAGAHSALVKNFRTVCFSCSAPMCHLGTVRLGTGCDWMEIADIRF